MKLQTCSLVEPFIFRQHVVLILEFLLTKHLGHRLSVGQAAVREKKTNQLWGFAFNNVDITAIKTLIPLQCHRLNNVLLKSRMDSGVLSLLHRCHIENYSKKNNH